MDKFYIVGIRHNPQLGSYLSKAIVAKPKMNKTCISAKFEDYGSSVSLKFCKDAWNNRYRCITSQRCVYGDYEYIGFLDKVAAIAELQKWTAAPGMSAERAKHGIEMFEAA